MRAPVLAAGLLVLVSSLAHADELFIVERASVADEKAVFATVESSNVVPARAARSPN